MTSSNKSVTIASFALAAMITLTAGVVSAVPASDPVWNAPTTKIARVHSAPTVANEQPAVFGVGTTEASRILTCLMPKAWQRGCEASAVKVAAR